MPVPAKRPFLLAALAAAAFTGGALICPPARAEYPERTVTLLVGFAAGGAPDALARIVAERLGAALGRSFVVENRVGAQGNIAMAAVARAAPDGYTLALVPVGNAAVNPALFPALPYDIERDFAPVSQIATVENVVVVAAGSPYRSIADLLAAGRSGAALTYASPGAGSLAHLAAELLARAGGFAMTHVPYRGVSPALTDVLRGEVTLTVAQLSTAKPLIESGGLRALAVASRTRSPVLPDVPTLAETPGLEGLQAVSWYALMAPAGTPPAIVDMLATRVSAVLAEPATAAALAAQGATPVGSSPADLARTIAADRERWGRVVREAGIAPP